MIEAKHIDIGKRYALQKGDSTFCLKPTDGGKKLGNLHHVGNFVRFSLSKSESNALGLKETQLLGRHYINIVNHKGELHFTTPEYQYATALKSDNSYIEHTAAESVTNKGNSHAIDILAYIKAGLTADDIINLRKEGLL